MIGGIKMLPDIHRATQKFYIFLIVYLTGCTPNKAYLWLYLSFGGLSLVNVKAAAFAKTATMK